MTSINLKWNNPFRNISNISKICYFCRQIIPWEQGIVFLIGLCIIWQHRSKKVNSPGFLIDTDCWCERNYVDGHFCSIWMLFSLTQFCLNPPTRFHSICSGIFCIYIQLDSFPNSLGIPSIFDLEILSILIICFSFSTSLSLERTHP